MVKILHAFVFWKFLFPTEFWIMSMIFREKKNENKLTDLVLLFKFNIPIKEFKIQRLWMA